MLKKRYKNVFLKLIKSTIPSLFLKACGSKEASHYLKLASAALQLKQMQEQVNKT
jgi:hypothetical protein